jgi:hypothetical protein
MDMFWHHHIPDHLESIANVRFLRCILEQIPRRRPQIPQPMPATECDEMQIPVFLIPFKSGYHVGILTLARRTTIN